MQKYLNTKLILILIFAVTLGFFDLPDKQQKTILPAVPEAVTQNKVHLGLDLQGGTQLDYKIDMRKVPTEDQEDIAEGVKEVINKRVNSLGVSEPNIYSSKIADETHIIVELAGIKDLNEAKKIVGKTIQLEFKEEKNEIDPNEKEKIQEEAKKTLDRLLQDKNVDFKQIGEEESLAFPGKVEFTEDEEHKFQDQLRGEIAQIAFEETVKAGDLIDALVETKQEDNEFTIDSFGSFKAKTGLNIYKVVEKIEEEREIQHEKEVKASHILIAYKGAERAAAEITRSEEEAKIRAEEVLQKIKNGGDFMELSNEYSDDETAKAMEGDLGFFTLDTMVKEFSEAAFAMKIGDISEPVKTNFGYHIIKVTDIKEAFAETKVEPKVKLARIFYSTVPDAWKETGLTGEHFVRADVQFNQIYQPYVSIKFNEDGAKLFEELTERNVGKKLAIFVGGDLISAPNVNEKIGGGLAQITGQFTRDEALNLARDLNTGAIPAPIVLSGQYTIGATLGQEALNKSINAGIIGIIVLALFMLAYYRLPGLIANIALSIYIIILIFLIKIALPAIYAMAIALAIFIAIMSQILKNDESGWEKFLAFILNCFILYFLYSLLSTPVVLTLAGIAGIILSIGMAVDANILIFERIKEELKNNRPINTAIEVGFHRAWSSIRDSNYSSLITCAILFYFGTSIIQGFALTLAMGILVSMFSAITITRTLLRGIINLKSFNNPKFFGIKKKETNWNIIGKSKNWFILSGTLMGLSLISIVFFGLKPGLDFTGGTLMEVRFENQEVTTESIKNILKELEGQSVLIENKETPPSESNTENLEAEATPSRESDADSETNIDTENALPPIPVENAKVDIENVLPETELVALDKKINLGTPTVIATDSKSFLIRVKHIDNDTLAMLERSFQERLGSFEEIRFTTIGPTIGETLKNKAYIALIVALIMIVLYIAFAFRKIPKRINPWRFGLCAIAALIHDILITVGVFVILGKFFGVEIDTLFITALLTILGFSVHDTIVVFDRIRENLKNQERGDTFDEIANKALNQTLARSVNTSAATLCTIVALYIFGADSIRYFIFALIIGIIVGTYSSIFIASPLLVLWRNWRSR